MSKPLSQMSADEQMAAILRVREQMIPIVDGLPVQLVAAALGRLVVETINDVEGIPLFMETFVANAALAAFEGSECTCGQCDPNETFEDFLKKNVTIN